jgi:hypothetical protein
MLKTIKHYFQKRFDRFYRLKRWHLILDISLLIIILFLISVLVKLTFFKPDFNFTTWVAPQHIQVDLNNPDLEINFITAPEAIHLEDGLNVELHIKNVGKIDVNNLKFNLFLKNNNFSISRIVADSNYELDKNVVRINGAEFLINEIKAGAEINSTFKVYFKDKIKGSKVINWQVNAEYYVDNQLFKNTINLVDIKVSASLNVQAAGYYNSPQGDQLGSGPLPPVVGLPTNFWVFFKAEPSGDFESFVMSAKLPKNVDFTESTSLLAGSLNYNPSSRQVIWRVDNLITGGTDYRAGFEVQLNPTADQIGKEAVLLSSIKFQALDSFSGLKVEKNILGLDTDLEHDTINKGEGKILAQ